MRPCRVARDSEWANTRLLELRAPVTQELDLVRSGGGPVEEVEEKERSPVAEELLNGLSLVRRGPHRRGRNSIAYLEHRRGAYFAS